MSRDDESLLSRWSRRKRGLEAEGEASSGSDVPSSARDTEKGPQGTDEGLPESELLKKLGLPDPDTLTSGDDFKAFMAKHVPKHLRQRALRRLWISNPVLANLDGLVDHGEDYTDAATVPEVLKTAYQVGKGFAKKAIKAELVAEAPPEPEDEVPHDDITAPDPPAAPQEIDETAVTEDDPPPPRPRRMAFRNG